MFVAAIDPGTALYIQVFVIAIVFAGVLLLRPKRRE